jgi:hypothetical protein
MVSQPENIDSAESKHMEWRISNYHLMNFIYHNESVLMVPRILIKFASVPKCCLYNNYLSKNKTPATNLSELT